MTWKESLEAKNAIKACQSNGIHITTGYSPILNSDYIHMQAGGYEAGVRIGDHRDMRPEVANEYIATNIYHTAVNLLTEAAYTIHHPDLLKYARGVDQAHLEPKQDSQPIW